MNKNIFFKISLTIIFFFNITPCFSADVTPSPGKVLESVETLPPVKPSEESKIEIIKPAKPIKTVEDTGPTIKVKTFIFSGNNIIRDDEILEVIDEYTRSELTMGQLQEAVSKTTEFYQQKGYFASFAYLPKQDIVDEKVKISILEGKVGNVNIKNNKRFNPEVINKLLKPAINAPALKADILERGLLLINDLPGIKVNSKLVRGDLPGTADINIDVKEDSVVSGYLSYDNFGSYYTGDDRLSVSFNINDFFGIGEQFSLNLLNAGNGILHKKFGLDFPLFYNGTRIGGSFTRMDYKVRKDFGWLESDGVTRTANIYLTHPFVRSRNRNINAKFGFTWQLLEQMMSNEKTRADEPLIFDAEISGNYIDSFLGRGVNTYSLIQKRGRTNYPFFTAGTVFPSDRSFWVTLFNFSRLQRLTDYFGLYLSVSGQLSENSLISSQQFSIGGPQKVRAYPNGEGDGDRGYITTCELQYNLPRAKEYLFDTNAQLYGFVDNGETSFNDTSQSNHLSGFGFGLNLNNVPLGFSAKMFYSWRITEDEVSVEPAARDKSGRFWLQLVHFFDY